MILLLREQRFQCFKCLFSHSLATASIDNLKKEYYTNIKISIARGATFIWLRTKCKFCTLEPESGNADVGKRFGA